MATKHQAVLSFLINKAIAGTPTTYQEIAISVGLPHKGHALSGALSPILGDIFRWCRNRNMPYITSLVVRKSGRGEGLPGPGFWKLYWEIESLDPKVYETETLTRELQEETFRYFAIGPEEDCGITKTSTRSRLSVADLIHVGGDSRPIKLRAGDVLTLKGTFWEDLEETLQAYIGTIAEQTRGEFQSLDPLEIMVFSEPESPGMDLGRGLFDSTTDMGHVRFTLRSSLPDGRESSPKPDIVVLISEYDQTNYSVPTWIAENALVIMACRVPDKPGVESALLKNQH